MHYLVTDPEDSLDPMRVCFGMHLWRKRPLLRRKPFMGAAEAEMLVALPGDLPSLSASPAGT